MLVHDKILRHTGAFFNNMFNLAVEPQENEDLSLSIGGVSGALLFKLIEYFYTGRIAIDSAGIEELMRVTHLLQFTEIYDHCIEFLWINLDASNCFKMWETARHYGEPQLQEMAYAFALNNFAEVSRKCVGLPRLTIQQFKAFLKDERLNVTEEEDVFTAVMRWVRFDLDGRKDNVDELVDLVRFQHIGQKVSNLNTQINCL